MTDLSSVSSTFLPTSVEERDLDSINFHDSLRFFQEQLNLNGNTFPSPSTNHMSNNDATQKYSVGFSIMESKEDNLILGPRTMQFEERAKSLSNCRITIPTVDTILESVRVLRAIQKSQEQRGTTWCLSKVLSSVDQSFQNSDSLEEVLNTAPDVIDETNNINEFDAVKTDNISIKQECDNSVSASNTESFVIENYETNQFWPSTNIKSQSDKQNNTAIDMLVENNVGNRTNVVENNIKDKDYKINLNKIENESLNGKENNHNVGNSVSGSNNENVGNTASLKDTSKGNNLTNSLPDLPLELEPKVNSYTNNNINSKIDDVVISSDSNCPSENFKQVSGLVNSNDICDFKQAQIFGTRQSSTTNLTIDTDDMQKEKVNDANSIQIKCVVVENIPKAIDSTDGKDRLGSPTPKVINPVNLRPDSGHGSCSSYYVSSDGSSCASPNHINDCSSGYCDSNSAFPSPSSKEESKIQSTLNEWTTEWLESRVDTEDEDSRTREIPSSPSTTSITTNVFEDGSTSEKLEIAHHAPSSDSEVTSSGEEEISEAKPNRTNETVETNQQIHADEASCNSLPATVVSSSSHECNDSENEGHIQDVSNIDDGNVNCQLSSNNSDEILNLEETCEINKNAVIEDLYSNEATFDINSNRDLKKNPENDSSEVLATKKFITSSWNLVSIVKLLYNIKEPEPPKAFSNDHNIEKDVFILSRGAFCQYLEGTYTMLLNENSLHVIQEKEILLSISLNHIEVHIENEETLKVDNKMGRCLYIKCDTKEELRELKGELLLHSSKCWQTECINLVHYPLKCHKNIVVIDLGSCSTRAGILMDQPTLPAIFFPSVCATNKTTGKHVYGMEALQPESRQNSTISFPLRPSVKIIKHSIDINQVCGIFQKIFQDLRIDPSNYAVQVCLPRSLSINAQNDLLKVLLEDLNVQSVSMAHQAILTLYAHNVSTGIVVDVGDRMDILPVIDGFIVETGVTRLPHGGQRLIHHMKHALAAKHISLSNDIDSFVVQYITENLSYVAEDYERELEIASSHPVSLRKSIDLHSFAKDENCFQHATLDDARFKVPEGLFNPDLWGLDSPGIHKLVQKAIQTASVDARKRIAGNIYVSGGVTLTPGFVERLRKEMTRLNEPRIVPKVFASNYRYHCTYIGACKFARMDVFPQVCVTKAEYSKNKMSSLKKFML